MTRKQDARWPVKTPRQGYMCLLCAIFGEYSRDVLEEPLTEQSLPYFYDGSDWTDNCSNDLPDALIYNFS